MTPEIDLRKKAGLDARTFQFGLEELATTIAFKVQREGLQHGLKPDFVAADVYYLLRQSQQTYNVFFYMNADETRRDPDWRPAYSAVILPLARTMIDCLYNITAILENPATNGCLFRESGFRLALESLDSDERNYGGSPRWDNWIARQRRLLDQEMRRNGFDEHKLRSEKRLWPTLSRYISSGGSNLTAHQAFLKNLTLGFWQEYSAVSHGSFQGLQKIAVFLAPTDLPHEMRPTVDDSAEEMISVHIPRMAAILLCTLTEIQGYLDFDGARINQRLHEIWDALIAAPEIKELYDKRYAQLMNEKGIHAE